MKYRSLLIIIGWSESGKAILQVRIAFFGRCKNIFRANMAQPPPLEKIGPYVYDQ